MGGEGIIARSEVPLRKQEKDEVQQGGQVGASSRYWSVPSPNDTVGTWGWDRRASVVPLSAPGSAQGKHAKGQGGDRR